MLEMNSNVTQKKTDFAVLIRRLGTGGIHQGRWRNVNKNFEENDTKRKKDEQEDPNNCGITTKDVMHM